MTAPALASPASEVRRLRAELADARRELAQLQARTTALAAADPGPVVTLATARAWAVHTAADAAEAAESAGYLAAVADIKAVHRDLADTWGRMAPDFNPWHVCCRECRRRGHRTGCRSCEDRTRATFSQPHPDDWTGSAA